MRGFFVRTFLWFWMIVILAIGAVLLPNFFRAWAIRAHWQQIGPGLLDSVSRRAARVFESSGERGLVIYFDELQRNTSVRALLFRNYEVLNQVRVDGSTQMINLERIASAKNGPQMRGTFGAQRVVSATGKTYVLVLEYRREFASRWPLIEVVLAVVAAGGLFCLLITRRVTSPIFQLRAAAAGIAEGRLDTRVSPALAGRADEIADLARDFDRMAERLQLLLTGHKRLLADVSHELRSPLARMNIALTSARQTASATNTRHLDRIQLEARRLDSLIGQLLTLSRIDSDVPESDRVPLDLAQLVHEVAGDAGFEARSLSRTVNVDCADPCTVRGSEELLRSAVENVVRNAVRHTGDGTAVEIALRREGSAAVLRVRDHGTGIPESMLSEIFVPFRKMTPASASGAGLGLAITERAIRSHGGSVRAENAPEGGLLMEIILPCQ